MHVLLLQAMEHEADEVQPQPPSFWADTAWPRLQSLGYNVVQRGEVEEMLRKLTPERGEWCFNANATTLRQTCDDLLMLGGLVWLEGRVGARGYVYTIHIWP